MPTKNLFVSVPSHSLRLEVESNFFAALWISEKEALKATKKALGLGFNPNTICLVDPSRRTALNLAAHVGATQSVCLLLAAGAHLEAMDARGRTSLFLAASNGQSEVISILLKSGADLNMASRSMTPLMEAIRSEHFFTVQQLVDAGADVNLKTKSNRTALMMAASVCSMDRKDTLNILHYLLDHGADPTSKDQKGRTTRQQYGHLEPLLRCAEERWALSMGMKEVEVLQPRPIHRI